MILKHLKLWNYSKSIILRLKKRFRHYLGCFIWKLFKDEDDVYYTFKFQWTLTTYN